MKQFEGKVAVITGAASGIGRGLAWRCAEKNMKVVLVDIDETNLSNLHDELKSQGATTLVAITDVSKAKEMEVLADRIYKEFGAVHLLFNNAGVAAQTSVLNIDLVELQWLTGINFWGTIHGIHYFVPRMITGGEQGHIVNTSSILGLLSGSDRAIYRLTKRGVILLSEQLRLELARKHPKLKVSVVCPAYVKTQIINSKRNIPESYKQQKSLFFKSEDEVEMDWNRIEKSFEVLPVDSVVNAIFDAIHKGKFKVLIHPIRDRLRIHITYPLKLWWNRLSLKK
tara:strand:+ start:4534 stop:5382 length:849 start_codon:yes stop_codon:yes gene_type:complete